MEGSYVRAAYPFSTTEKGEISLAAHDVVEIISVVDSNWLKGKLNDQVGNFPVNFVENLTLPITSPGQKLFAAVKDFPAQADGDLGFKKGDIIHGLKQIDENWWKGKLDGNEGIFPIILTKELKTKPTGTNTPVSQQQLSTELFKVKALVDCTAQIDDELGFSSGEIIRVTKILDDGWYYGQCGGKEGMFLPDLVEPLGGTGLPPATANSKKDASAPVVEKTVTYTNASPQVVETHSPQVVETRSVDQNEFIYRDKSSSFTRENTRSSLNSPEEGVTPYGKTLYYFTGENENELSFNENEIVKLISHVDQYWFEGEIDGKIGLVPVNYVDVIVDCPWMTENATATTPVIAEAPERIEDVAPTTETEKSNEDMYGLVLYDFVPASDNDLRVFEGDTITILGQLDEHWYEAKLDDGQVGYCPVTYVEVIGGGPAPPSLVTKSDNEKTEKVEETINYKEAPPSLVTKSDNEKTEKVEETINDKEDVQASDGHHANVKVAETAPSTAVSSSISNNDIINSSPVDISHTPSTEAPQTQRQNSLKKPSLRPKPNLKPKPKVTEPVMRKSAPPGRQQDRTSSGSIQLDDMIQAELHRASVEADMRIRSSSRSSDETEVAIETLRPAPQVIRKSSPLPDYSALREAINENVTPLSSSKKGPPPRPVGPRLASAPPKIPLIPIPASSVNKPVPQRAAPPRPTQATPPTRPPTSPVKPAPPSDRGTPPPRPRPISHLVRHSSITDTGVTDNEELIVDLKRRKAEKEQDIENCKKAEQELRTMLANTSLTESERFEIEENVEFYEANIRGLSNELKHMSDELRHLQPGYKDSEEERRRDEAIQKQLVEERRRKRQETRARVISELVDTEQSYLRDIQMCWDSFRGPAATQGPNDIDKETLFGNMDEIGEMSQKLLTSLESAVNGKDFNSQVLATCFSSHTEEMKKVYAVYCRNHDDVLALLEKYDDRVDVQEYFNKGLQLLRQHSTVFDLGSVLIKPVQRILKYPLLLNELLKSTEDGHPDKPALVVSIGKMTDVATAINEYKRRKDLAYKYRNEKSEKLSDRMSKLTFHSIKKKSNRLGMRLTTNLGMGQQTRDEQFEKEEMRFRYLEKAVKTFLKDVALYCDQLQDAVVGHETIGDDLVDFYSDYTTPEVLQYQETQRQLAHEYFDTFKSVTEDRVITPLSKLILMFQGPNNVIQKRNDKLLDYDSWSIKVEKTKDISRVKAVQDELNKAKNNYEAMNAQLLDELPKLYDISMTVFKQGVSNFMQAYREFLNNSLKNMYPLLEISTLASSKDPLLDAFNQEHAAACDSLALLSFIPKSLSSKARGEGKGRHSMEPRSSVVGETQSKAHQCQVIQAYPAEKVFVCNQSYRASDMMEISMEMGTIVGVVKEQDPMGCKDRWFVDNGGMKGFVPKSILSPYDPSQAPDTNVTSLLDSDHSELVDYMLTGSTIWYGVNEPVTPERSTTQLLQPSPPPSYQQSQLGVDNLNPAINLNEGQLASPPPSYQLHSPKRLSNTQYYQALYTFDARTDNEVSVQEGQLVIILKQHDQEGNPEWWLVATDTQQGYAPANYFTPAQGPST